MHGHRGPVSALSMSYDEKGFFSAGWDGDAIVGSSHGCYSMSFYNSSGLAMGS